jgi:opacity protein-like surface antigen
MRSLKLALLATVATAGLSSAAFAADLLVTAPPPTPIVDNNFNFDGAYIGIFTQGQTAPNAFGLGLNFGVNALMDSLLIGGDLEVAASTGGHYDAQLTGKVGALITDSAIAYIYSGIGTRTATSYYAPVGIGAEFAVADNLGLKLEAQYNFDLTSSAQNSMAAKIGLNWHF